MNPLFFGILNSLPDRPLDYTIIVLITESVPKLSLIMEAQPMADFTILS